MEKIGVWDVFDCVEVKDDDHNQIVPEEEPKFFNEEETIELYQTCIHLMDEFIKEHPKLISEPDFDGW